MKEQNAGNQAIFLPKELTELLVRNNEAIMQVERESAALLRGFMTGCEAVDQKKQYQLSADFSAIIEIKNE